MNGVALVLLLCALACPLMMVVMMLGMRRDRKAKRDDRPGTARDET